MAAVTARVEFSKSWSTGATKKSEYSDVPRGMPGPHAEIDRAGLRAGGRRERSVLIAAIGRVTHAGRETLAVDPGSGDRGFRALVTETGGKTRARRVVAAEACLDAAAFGGSARDDVDDATDRVRSVERRARALDDFDALDELRRDILDGRGSDRPRVDAQTVHQHEHVVRFRAANEERGLLARTAEARDLNPRDEAQRIAEVRGGMANQVIARDQLDAREDLVGGRFDARGRDDDGFDGLAAGGCGKKYQCVHSCSSRAVNREFTGRGSRRRSGRSSPHPCRPPRLAHADGPVSGLTACPWGTVRIAFPPGYRQWLQAGPA